MTRHALPDDHEPRPRVDQAPAGADRAHRLSRRPVGDERSLLERLPLITGGAELVLAPLPVPPSPAAASQPSRLRLLPELPEVPACRLAFPCVTPLPGVERDTAGG